MRKLTILALLLMGALSLHAQAAGYDTQPEGPTIEGITASAVNATVAPGPVKDSVRASFPATSTTKPAAILRFRDTNISDRMGLALDVKNAGAEPARIYADLNGDNWVRGYVTAPPGKTVSLYVFQRRRALSPADAEIFPGMHGIPGGKMSLWAGIEEPILANRLTVFVVAPDKPVDIELSNIRPFGSSRLPDLTNFFPFIDKYGQYKHKEWPDKIHSDAELKAVLQKEDADLAAHPSPKDLDQYGGWAAGPQLKASGHFRVEKYEGKWWFVDPEGHLFWSNGIDCVGFSQSSTRVQGRENFFDDISSNGNFLAANLQLKYGDDWRTVASDRLGTRMKSWGINSLGGGADRSVIQSHKVPYTVQLSSRGSGGRGARGGPGAATRGGQLNGFGRGGAPGGLAPTSRPATRPLAGRGPTSRTGFPAPTTGSGPPTTAPGSPEFAENIRRMLTAAAEQYKDDPWCIGFFIDNEIHPNIESPWFEAYYKTVGTVAKQVMPDTLYLGSRLDFHNYPDDPASRHDIVRAAARYCDVISFNFYKFTLDDVVLPTGVDRPAIIGEFHMGALDRGKFHTGLRSVLDQEQRAEAYRYYVTSALKNPAIVGAHWFQCYDESTTGRFDGENYQIGFMDICDTPYWETVQAARDVGYQLYHIRSGK